MGEKSLIPAGQDQPPSAQAYSQHPSGLTQNQSYPMSSSSQSGSSYASSTSYPSTQQGQPLPQNQSRPSLSDRQQSFSDSAQSHQVVSPVGNGSGGPSISAPRPGLAEHRQSSGNTSISVAGQGQGQNMMGAASATSLGSMTVGGSSQMGGMGGMGVGMGGKEGEAVPVGFDEGVLRGLCEMDVSLLSRTVWRGGEAGRGSGGPLCSVAHPHSNLRAYLEEGLT